MSEHRRATAVYRSAVGLLRHGDDGEGAATSGWTFEEVMERLGEISPSGWPQCDPRRYDEQLQLKRAACELAFPECSKCDLHVFPSPPLHHRMRCRFGITSVGVGCTRRTRCAWCKGNDQAALVGEAQGQPP